VIAIPLPYQDGSGLETVTSGMVATRLEFVAIPGSRGDPVEEALGVPVKIAQPFGLQAVGDHAKEEMPRQVVGGLAAEHRSPSCPQAGEIEIAQVRDLVLEVDCRRSHDHAARRVDFGLTGCRASGDTIR
jgi:hypothetical protein